MNDKTLVNSRLKVVLTRMVSGISLRTVTSPLMTDVVLLYFVILIYLTIAHSGSVIGSSNLVTSRM